MKADDKATTLLFIFFTSDIHQNATTSIEDESFGKYKLKPST